MVIIFYFAFGSDQPQPQSNHRGTRMEVRGPAGLFSWDLLFSLRAPASVKAGEQVFIQYDINKSNAELALDYGFIESTPERNAYTITLQISESDDFYDDKLDIAEMNGLGETAYFDINLGRPLPPQCFRICGWWHWGEQMPSSLKPSSGTRYGATLNCPLAVPMKSSFAELSVKLVAMPSLVILPQLKRPIYLAKHLSAKCKSYQAWLELVLDKLVGTSQKVILNKYKLQD
ncbi:unnamed protein product, partial [Thlaspi arvense]